MEISDDGLTYLCGGEMDFADFFLDITSDDLDPKEISGLLGREPTYCHRRGEANRTGKAVYKFGRWQLSTGREDSRSCSSVYDAFDAFVRTLHGHEAPWKQISTKHDARIMVTLWMRTWNREFDLSSFALSELGRRGLGLHFDSYMEPDDQEDGASEEGAPMTDLNPGLLARKPESDS
jgi:hypothetical protein